MTADKELIPTIYKGWHDYQTVLTKAIAPLDAEQLSLRASANQRSVREIAAHVIGARARWFNWIQAGIGGDEFKAYCGWDRKDAKVWDAEEIVAALEATWTGVHAAIARWTLQDWEQTWPGEDETEPEIITRQWVIWHLIEHDLYHGGQISVTLEAHGVSTFELN